MNRYYRFILCLAGIIAFAFFAALPGPACAQGDNGGKNSTGEELKQDVEELMESIREYSAEKQQKAAERLREDLDEMEKRLSELERRFEKEKSEMSREARDRIESSLEALREKRKDAAEWLEEFKTSSRKAWDNIREGLSEAFRDFSKSLEKTDQELETRNI